MVKLLESAEDYERAIEEVRIAKRVLLSLYPEAGGHDKPRSAGIVLRRFLQRESDLLGVYKMKWA